MYQKMEIKWIEKISGKHNELEICLKEVYGRYIHIYT